MKEMRAGVKAFELMELEIKETNIPLKTDVI